MIKSVVSKEYQELQKQIVQLQEHWKQTIDPETIRPSIDQAAIAAGVPIVSLTAIDFDISLFLQWIEELNVTLITNNPELEPNLAAVRSVLTDETVIRWIEEAYSFNQTYFEKFSEEHGLEQWIPPFLAETALRPYLQLTAEKTQHAISHAMPGAGCPVCGEPVRLAVLEAEGKKVVHCPRCHAHWNGRRLECSHCGNTDHEKIHFLTIEGDPVSQIQVCGECNGYIKIIDTRQYIEKPSAALMDLNSIHLDYVAQEQGYSSVGEKKQTN
ncbi:formate dehydrogenase accessory protein FdhE [Neobacillus dielmonensis]|uniref:formate dehydrogenase accessory protein FdhE n=1 Tax=Neobacillus dielmonensis TaxID=1347369 RepID=UPI0005AB59D5|nr:formate dehydrogenase accessory protein FdhE [Neobacillus dielmonensis]